MDLLMVHSPKDNSIDNDHSGMAKRARINSYHDDDLARMVAGIPKEKRIPLRQTEAA